MDDMARSGHERTITVVSVVVTLVVLGACVTFGGGEVGIRLRGLLGHDGRVHPVVEPTSTGPFRYLNTQQDGTPVGFDPCRSIRYEVNPAGAPAGWREYVQRAVAEVSADTGLDFTDDGTTDDRDFSARMDDDGRAEPVLIGWADASEVGSLSDDVAGIGGPVMVTIGNQRAYVSGSVVIDTDVSRRVERTRGSGYADDVQVALLLHELGHLVGLDHVDDTSELMYPTGVTRAHYGPGDREGLAAIGAIGCS